MPRGRKRKPENNYFNPAVEEAVCTYLNSDSQIEKEKAFALIYPAFCKIAEVMFNKMKLTYYDESAIDFQMDAVAFMVEKMDKFDCNAGKKAFSYFTVVCKHYLILQNNKNHKYYKRYNPISELGEGFDLIDESIEGDKIKSEAASLLEGFTNYMQVNFNKIFDKKSKSFGELLIDKLKNWETIDDINKNKIMADIFQNANIPTRARLTKMNNNLQAQYNLFKKRWDSGDTSMEFIEKTRLTAKEKEYVLANYEPYNPSSGHRNTGLIKIAKKFGLTEVQLREYMKNFI